MHQRGHHHDAFILGFISQASRYIITTFVYIARASALGFRSKPIGDTYVRHSKWATTKHRKGAQDAKRSALFSKLSRNITVAARLGGDPLPENNASLAAAVAKAKAQSMPKDKIKSAIDKAFGSGADAAVYENIVYEGYGPAGVAVYVDCLTDNRNRTAADVRSAFSHAGGNLGTSARRLPV